MSLGVDNGRPVAEYQSWILLVNSMTCLQRIVFDTVIYIGSYHKIAVDRELMFELICSSVISG